MKNEPTIFVVDDDNSARNGIVRLLRTAGYNVKEFASSEKFIESMEPVTTGCIVLDLRMPGISGLELAKKLYEIGTYLNIIVVSADDDQEIKQMAKDIEAVGFFRKPVDGKALLDAIYWAVNSDANENNNRNKKSII